MPQPAASPEHLAEKELVRRLNASNTARQFGFVLAAAEPGRAVVRMRVAERHKQVHGVVHGGVLAALADTAGGLATYMSVPRGSRVATVEMKMNYLEPVEKGTVVADARMIRVGKTLAVVECDLRDETEKACG
ncbi:MAG: PaaI family thioesterase [Candidatus Acidiferrales bacterium]